jgi:hypothetical protein
VLTSELKVVGRTWQAEHYPIESVVVLKRSEYAQTNAFRIEPDDFFQMIRRMRDA